jgi:hypothetical protein
LIFVDTRRYILPLSTSGTQGPRYRAGGIVPYDTAGKLRESR